MEYYSYHQTRLKLSHDTEQKHQIEMKLRLHSAMQGKVIADTRQRMGLVFHEEMELGGVKTSVALCEHCFVHLNGIVCIRTFGNWKNELKSRRKVNAVGANLQTSLSTTQKVHDVTSWHYRNILEARKALGDYGLSEIDLHMSCLPKSPAYTQAYHWLANFIALLGDQAPNRDNKVQLPGIYTMTGIYTMYRHHVKLKYTGDENNILSPPRFMDTWRNIFPNVTLTKFCHVSGKCSACHWLYERQEIFRSERELHVIKFFGSIHKIMIEMSRGIYMSNRQKAQDHPELYMSLIIDGMSQDHCVLPYCANQTQKSNILKQKIMGAKQHGFSKSFYRTFPHVCGGTNLAIEVLLHEIEKRMNYCELTNKIMPAVLFLQIDGGPENTSKSFYAMISQLKSQKVFKRIEVARLPVGHTHEDIDALFGTLWKASRHMTITTPQDWKRMAIRAFTKEGHDYYVDSYDDTA